MTGFLEIEEFFVEGKAQEKSHVLLHISEPSTNHEKKRGYFFLVAEINNTYPEQIMNLQNIIDEIEEEYYLQENESENLFSEILEDINRRSSLILNYEKSEIHCLTGILKDEQLIISYHGKPQAYLFYQNKEEIKEADILNLDENDSAEKSKLLFSELVEGKINPGDFIFISTPHVKDYFSIDRIKKILISRNTAQAVSHIQKVLADLRNQQSFGGIFFHSVAKHSIPRTGKAPQNFEGSEESLNKLFASTKKTEETLSPPIFGDLGEKLKNWSNNKEGTLKEKNNPPQIKNLTDWETNHRTEKNEPRESIIGKFLIFLGRIIVFVFTRILLIIKNIAIAIGRLIIGTIYFITNQGGQRKRVLEQLKNFLQTKKNNFYHLPLLSKTILVITIILGLIFLGNITYLKIKEKREMAKTAYNNLIQAVTDKKDAAEAKLIYGQDDEAWALIQEAKKITEKIPENSKEEEKKKTELQSEIEATLNKLRKISVIQPEMVVNLNQTKVEKIVLLENKIFAFGKDDENLYQIDILTKNSENKPHNSLPKLSSGTVPKEEDKIVFITSDSQLVEYSAETKALTSRTIVYPVAERNIISSFVYNRKLYTLDNKNNQIYRHNQTATGYDKGSSWLKNSIVELTDGISLAIDGDIFVLSAKGQIIKLIRGEKQQFEISGLDPALTNPTEIWTYNNTEKIFILEPINKRVVVIDKQGKFLTQYTAKEWQNPTGMAIDVDDKQIYILDNNKIYRWKM